MAKITDAAQFSGAVSGSDAGEFADNYFVSDTLSARELEEKFDCCVCVDPDKPEEIAAAIRTLLDDPERRAAMGERGYGALQTRFNWQTEEKKLLALYEELLSLKGE